MWEVKLLCWMGERDTRMWQFPLCFALNTPKLSGVYKTMAPTALYIKPWCWPSHRQVAGCRSNNSKYQSWEEKKRKERKKNRQERSEELFPFSVLVPTVSLVGSTVLPHLCLCLFIASFELVSTFMDTPIVVSMMRIVHFFLPIGNFQDWSPHMSFVLKGCQILTFQLKSPFKSKTSI